MASTTLHPGPAAHGGTAMNDRSGLSRRIVGNALRAVRVFATTAVEVVLLGNGGRRF